MRQQILPHGNQSLSSYQDYHKVEMNLVALMYWRFHKIQNRGHQSCLAHAPPSPILRITFSSLIRDCSVLILGLTWMITGILLSNPFLSAFYNHRFNLWHHRLSIQIGLIPGSAQYNPSPAQVTGQISQNLTPQFYSAYNSPHEYPKVPPGGEFHHSREHVI